MPARPEGARVDSTNNVTEAPLQDAGTHGTPEKGGPAKPHAPEPRSAPAPSPIPKLAVVICTYKRQQLLADLFDSLAALDPAPWRIVVVDNENAPKTTGRMVAELARRLDGAWGPSPEGPDAEGGSSRVVYAPQEENGGGAGGFSAGTRRAWELGAEWFWLMDDDVTVLPEAIARLGRWTDRFQAIQGSRLDYDGGAFYWQYRFITPLGIPNPVATADLGPEGWRPANQLCFEGGMFSRKVVDAIGFPDARYFIYGDDAVYGYLASKVYPAAVVSDLIIKRARVVENWDIAGVRQLNSTSDTNRYYIMRNRGYTARYMQLKGDYRPLLFRVGTFATFCKELIRLAVVDKSFKTGVPALRRGMRDARKIIDDPSWEPMPRP